MLQQLRGSEKPMRALGASYRTLPGHIELSGPLKPLTTASCIGPIVQQTFRLDYGHFMQTPNAD